MKTICATEYFRQAKIAAEYQQDFFRRAIAAGATHQVHDEIIFEDPEKAEAFRRAETLRWYELQLAASKAEQSRVQRAYLLERGDHD